MEEALGPCREYRGNRNQQGYGRVPFGAIRLNAAGRPHGRYLVSLHRWVVEQVEGPLLPGEIVMHRCDNPPCFLYDHLRRGTPTENNLDCLAKGRFTFVRGTDHPNAKLTDDQVTEVRTLRASGVSQRRVAAAMGVSRALVRKIERGQHR